MSAFSSKSILLLIASLTLVLPASTMAFSSPHTITQRNHHQRSKSQHYLSRKHSPLEDEPWDKDDSYWDMLQAASKDPVTFEKFIDESMARSAKKSNSIGGSGQGMASSSKLNKGNVNGNDENIDGTKKKYVPIEEWEEQRKNGENMSWEERLQWESQRGGDQFRQNEILRQNLKQF